MKTIVFAVGTLALLVSPAIAGNKIMRAGQAVPVAKSAFKVRPAIEWNRLSARPGRNSETWTLDGDALNDLTFYGGIADGKTLFREVDKRNRPLPRMSKTMLITDVPTLVENSYRIALNTPLFTLGGVEPVTFLGGKGIRFTYSFTNPGDDLPRRGEARAALVNGKLYLITFEAPRLHFFDESVGAAREVANSASL